MLKMIPLSQVILNSSSIIGLPCSHSYPDTTQPGNTTAAPKKKKKILGMPAWRNTIDYS